MDKIKAAFEQHQVVSVKQLHQLICPKEKEGKLEVEATLQKLKKVA